MHPRVQLKAALIAIGPEAFLSGRSAAAVWGLRAINPREIEVSVHAGSTPTRAGVVVHRTRRRPHESEVVDRGGLRVSSIPRMLVELAARERLGELNRLLTESAQRDLLDVHEFEAALERHRHRRGIGVLRRVAEDYRPGPDRKSELERSFDRWLQGHPEVPRPQRNIHLGPWEIDCLWADQQLALELDGRRWHVAAEQMERDRRKDAWLLINGIAPLRITYTRWHTDRQGAVDDLVALLDRQALLGRQAKRRGGDSNP